MKKMQITVVLIAMCFSLVTCKETPSIELKHSDKEQVIACNNENNALLNEALYTFEDDISQAYDPESKLIVTSYARFLYSGFSGTAEYNSIASQHALDIRKELVKEGIIVESGIKSNLNYDHPVVVCLLENLEDRDLSQTIDALITTNTMDPKLLNSRMRNFGRLSGSHRYTALYVALDTYYQQLTMAALSPQQVNE